MADLNIDVVLFNSHQRRCCVLLDSPLPGGRGQSRHRRCSAWFSSPWQMWPISTLTLFCLILVSPVDVANLDIDVIPLDSHLPGGCGRSQHWRCSVRFSSPRQTWLISTSTLFCSILVSPVDVAYLDIDIVLFDSHLPSGRGQSQHQCHSVQFSSPWGCGPSQQPHHSDGHRHMAVSLLWYHSTITYFCWFCQVNLPGILLIKHDVSAAVL